MFELIKSFFITPHQSEYKSMITSSLPEHTSESLSPFLIQDIINIVLEYGDLVSGKLVDLKDELSIRDTLIAILYHKDQLYVVCGREDYMYIKPNSIYVNIYNINTLERINTIKINNNKGLGSWNDVFICRGNICFYRTDEHLPSYFDFYSLSTGSHLYGYEMENVIFAPSTNEKYIYTLDNDSIFLLIRHDSGNMDEVDRIGLNHNLYTTVEHMKMIISNNKLIIHDYRTHIYNEDTFELLYTIDVDCIVRTDWYNYYFYKNLLYVVNHEGHLYTYDNGKLVGKMKIFDGSVYDVSNFFINGYKIFMKSNKAFICI